MPLPHRASLSHRLCEIVQRSRMMLLGAGIVLLVVGAKLWLIDVAGSSLPVLDQIDGEGEMILRPWVEGRLGWANFWHPHNEHRIVLTKLVAWGLVALNGQWDAYVEMLVGGLLHALLVPALLTWIRPQVRGPAFALLAIALTAMWMLPINWENTLQGFQTQFYFVLWLGFLQCRGVLGSDRPGWAWGLGHLCGLLALGAMASGTLPSLAIVVTLGLEALRSRRLSRLRLTSLGLSLLWVGLGWWWRNPVPGHEVLRAHSVGEFATQFGRMLAWPHVSIALAVGVLAMVVPYRVIWLLRQPARNAAEQVFIGLAAWVFIIMAATAFYRANGEVLSSRYVDQLYLGLALQGLACALIPSRIARWGLLTIWVLAAGVALGLETRKAWRETLVHRGALVAKQEANVRQFLATGDARALTDVPAEEVPHPLPAVLVERWSHPSIQRLMPAAVRRPVAIPGPTHLDLTGRPTLRQPVIAQSPDGTQPQPWQWQSPQLPATSLPVLRFQFMGGLGDPGAALRMAIVGEHSTRQVNPDGPSRERWKTINVIRPDGAWHIELHDADDREQVILTAPVELGWLSWGAEKLIKHHAWFLGFGAVLGGLGAWLSARSGRSPTTQVLPPL